MVPLSAQVCKTAAERVHWERDAGKTSSHCLKSHHGDMYQEVVSIIHVKSHSREDNQKESKGFWTGVHS